MLDQKENTDLIQADAVVSLDNRNEKILDEYLQSTGNFLQEELEKFQTLTALFPAALPIVQPNPKVKDEIARRLYRLRGEIRQKKTIQFISQVDETHYQISATASQQPEDFEYEKIVEFKQPDEFEKVGSVEIEEIKALIELEELGCYREPKRRAEKVNEKKPFAKQYQLEADNKERQKRQAENNFYFDKHVNKKTGWGILQIIWILIFLVGIAIMYLYFAKEIGAYKERIVKLSVDKSNLIVQFSQLKNFSEILEAKDLLVVDLNRTKSSLDLSGKLFLSFSKQAGYLQLTNLLQPNDGNIYQLWMQNRAEFISLGRVNPMDQNESFHLKALHLTSYIGLKFLLTEESSPGLENPAGKNLLEGSIK